jgi:hypothetical protein
MIRRLVPVLVAALALLGLAAVPAAAAPAASCYGGAIALTYHYHAAYVTYGTYTTTSRCKDINVRMDNNDGQLIVVCVVFVDHTDKCNDNGLWHIIGPGWLTAATDVKDGTHFQLRVHGYDEGAQLEPFHLAF